MDRIRGMNSEEKETSIKCVKRAGIYGIIGALTLSSSAYAISTIFAYY
jgi:hypothetical protein